MKPQNKQMRSQILPRKRTTQTIFNFCFAHLENELWSVTKFKPELYLRYADDIFGCLEISLYMKSDLISMFYWFFFQHHNVLYVVIPLLY